jgi:hypothetical protein
VRRITRRRSLGFTLVGLSLAVKSVQASSIVTFETGKQPAALLHVATTGNDTTGNGSAGSPFATIERAAQAAGPGTAIRVHAGTYAGGMFIGNLAGTAAAPIWIGGAPGEARPVFEGGGNAIQFSQVRNLVVHDLEIRDTSVNGINTDDGGDYANPDATRHVVFRDLYIHHVGSTGNQDCLKLSGVNDYFVLDSEIAFCGGGGSGIDHVGCHGGLIAGNFFHDMGVNGNAIQTKGGSADIEIRANRVVNGGGRAMNVGGSTDLEFFRPPVSTSDPNAEARDIRVIANVIEGSPAPLAFVGAVDSLAAHNTVVSPTNWLMRILQETTTADNPPYTFLACGNNTVAGNIFYFDRSDLSFEDVNIGPDTAPGTLTFSRNLWYAYDNPAQSQPTNLPVAETGGIAGQDPLFLDAAGGDYRLTTGSPAAFSGLPIAGVVTDFRGARYAPAPSRGAFEYDVIFLDCFE